MRVSLGSGAGDATKRLHDLPRLLDASTRRESRNSHALTWGHRRPDP